MTEVSVFKFVIKKSSSMARMMDAISEFQDGEKKKAAEVATLLTAIDDLTRNVCDLQNQQRATCKPACDLSATISGGASVTKSLVQDDEDHGKKKNDGDGIAMDHDHVGVQDNIDKHVDMPPGSSSPTDSSSPPVNRPIMVPASNTIMPTGEKREVCQFWRSGMRLPLDPSAKDVHLLMAVSFCSTIVRHADELLDSYGVSIWEPGDHQRRQDYTDKLNNNFKKINWARKVQELQSGSMPDDISNDSLKEVVKFATTTSCRAFAHIMDVANSRQYDELVHRSTSHDAPVLHIRGTPLAPDDTTGALSDNLSVASRFTEVTPSKIGK